MKSGLALVIALSLVAAGLCAGPVVAQKDDDPAREPDSYNPDFSKGSIFEPEEDWKEIQPDQHLPGGLDIRMNLETGKKEARLLPKRSPELRASFTPVTEPASHHDPNQAGLIPVEVEDSSDASAEDPHASLMEHQDMPASSEELAVEKIKEIFLGLPEPEPELLEAMKSNLSPEEMNELLRRLWEKRQVQLKEAMERIVDDAQLLKKFIVELLDETVSDDAKIGILQDIEYLVSKIDNARDFVKMDGLVALLPLLNSTNLELREHSAWALGTAVKFQKDLQENAAKLGALPLLLNTFEEGIAAKNVAASRALYALGAVLRGSDDAHFAFMAYGGLKALSDATSLYSHEASAFQKKIAVKAVTLLFDLFQEQAFQSCGSEGDQASCIEMETWEDLFLPTALQRSQARGVDEGNEDDKVVVLEKTGEPVEATEEPDLACQSLDRYVTMEVCVAVHDFVSTVVDGSPTVDTLEKSVEGLPWLFPRCACQWKMEKPLAPVLHKLQSRLAVEGGAEEAMQAVKNSLSIMAT